MMLIPITLDKMAVKYRDQDVHNNFNKQIILSVKLHTYLL